jgi:hypothetical protein
VIFLPSLPFSLDVVADAGSSIPSCSKCNKRRPAVMQGQRCKTGELTHLSSEGKTIMIIVFMVRQKFQRLTALQHTCFSHGQASST